MKEKNRYVIFGLVIFCTVGATMLFYDTFFGDRVLPHIVSRFVRAMRPILYGAVMAYLLSPMVNFFESMPASPPPLHAGRKKEFSFAFMRSVSMFLTWAIIGVLLYLLASVLLPELYQSILQLISNGETYYLTMTGWIQQFLESNPGLESWAMAQIALYYEGFNNWVKTDALQQMQTLMSALSGGILTTMNFLKDLLVGFIVSIYLMATKEHCAAQARKILYSLFPRKVVYWILRGSRKAHRIFSGFVQGKLLDSLIIGILCLIGCSILDFPYVPLISVFVGVTNIIPFFGPFLGAIPSTFLILLVSPIQAVYFLIFVFALQQLDGNVIGPKILGDKTGLSSLWVIIAILVGGSFFGFTGMFFGVPVCACLYNGVNFLVESRLRNKQMPVETEAYDSEFPLEEEPPKQSEEK